MGKFRLFDRELNYIRQRNETIIIGERRIELPIAMEWVKEICLHSNEENFIEVGAVLASWTGWDGCGHDVVDPYDPYPYAIREDAENYDYMGKNVLSISTIEHIGGEDYGNTDIDENKAVRVLEKIMREAEHYLITIPTGYNKALDEYIKFMPLGDTQSFQFKQIEEVNEWKQQTMFDCDAQYNSPFPFANQVLFLTDNLDWVK